MGSQWGTGGNCELTLGGRENRKHHTERNKKPKMISSINGWKGERGKKKKIRGKVQDTGWSRVVKEMRDKRGLFFFFLPNLTVLNSLGRCYKRPYLTWQFLYLSTFLSHCFPAKDVRHNTPLPVFLHNDFCFPRYPYAWETVPVTNCQVCALSSFPLLLFFRLLTVIISQKMQLLNFFFHPCRECAHIDKLFI